MDTILPPSAQETASPIPLWPGKLRATAIHLAISTVIFAAFLYLVLAIWYPGYFFDVDGGWEGLQIMAAVDLVLGPALTLIVFNPRKKRREIIVDLALIGLFQLSALAWGAQMVYQQRPVAVVEYQGNFRALTVDLLEVQHKTLADLTRFGPDRPFIHVRPARNSDEEANVMLGILNDGLDPAFQFAAFSEFNTDYAAIRQQRVSVDGLSAKYPAIKHALDRFAESSKTPLNAVDFYKFGGRYQDALIAFKRDGSYVGALTFKEPERIG